MESILNGRRSGPSADAQACLDEEFAPPPWTDVRLENYLVMVPQAMRSPAFPAGSLFMSSALA